MCLAIPGKILSITNQLDETFRFGKVSFGGITKEVNLCMVPEAKPDDYVLVHVGVAISIVDEYLEHARVIIFYNSGKEKVFISSADWMVRNIDHRIEAACPIFDKKIQQELKDILQIQLADNIKARILDNDLSNQYVNPRNTRKVRSQVETYNYLFKKSNL